MTDALEPVDALREIAYLLEREVGTSRRATAFRRAADVVEGLSPAERAQRAAASSWTDLPGIGASTGTVIAQASAGQVPDYLAGLRAAAAAEDERAAPLLSAIRGDLHAHTDASDGGATLRQMAEAARAMGREYLAITDHSPNLTVARGLDASRLRAQLAAIAELNAELDDFVVLSGIETDILLDGSLDQEPALLAQLDVVVASVHSKLRMDAEAMTLRMVAAVANPYSDILGHCTGRLIAGGRGTRPQSTFDAEIVFEACRQFGKAVEINARPERMDPPPDLLALAAGMGCLFSIDTDAHAPGQLEWTVNGVRSALDAQVPAERIVNTWPRERLLDWTASHQA